MAQIGKSATRDACSVRPGAAPMTLFLESLAESSNVAASARSAGGGGGGQCDVSGTAAQCRIHGAPARGAVRRVRAADHGDLPIGEGQETWRITLSTPGPGFAPWERTSPVLHIAAAVLAALPPDTMIAIRQVSDF